jgi:hypothetical protein
MCVFTESTQSVLSSSRDLTPSASTRIQRVRIKGASSCVDAVCV